MATAMGPFAGAGVGVVISVVVATLVAVMYQRSVASPFLALERACKAAATGDANAQSEMGGLTTLGELPRVVASLLAESGTPVERKAIRAQAAAAAVAPSALLLLDNRGQVTFSSDAAKDLLHALTPEFAKDGLPSAPVDLVGRPIGDLHPAFKPGHSTGLGDLVHNPGGQASPKELDIGALRLLVSVAALPNAPGSDGGAVLKLSDITESRRHAAMIDSIDKHQIRAEFSVDGKLLAANEAFASIMGSTVDALTGRDRAQLISLDLDPTAQDGERWQQLLSGKPLQGKFGVRTQSSPVVAGGFSGILKPDGSMDRVLLLVNDVTKTEADKQEAENQRRQMETDQQSVVRALSIALQKLSGGDLTATIETTFASEYESLRMDFNKAVSKLAEALSGVVELSDTLRTEAVGIAQTAEGLSKRTETAAATVEETAAAL
ncbi:MAG: hypothetical protein AAFX00_13660, partial [Pseudomonadota bacterium]